MELKEYQASTLDAFARWLDALEEARLSSEAGVAALQTARVDIPPDLPNYPKLPGKKWCKPASWRIPPVSTSAARTTQAGPFRTFALKSRRVGARRYWPPPHCNGSAGRPA